jgi:hypothetical protein
MVLLLEIEERGDRKPGQRDLFGLEDVKTRQMVGVLVRKRAEHNAIDYAEDQRG